MTDVSPQPNDQSVDPPVSADDMDQFIKSLEAGYGENISLSTLAPQGTTTEPEPEPDKPSTDDEPEPEPEPEGDPNAILINGNRIPREDVERLYNFDQYLRANPDTAARVAEAVNPRQPTVPKASQAPSEFTPPPPPDFLDLDDPQTKFLWEQHVATRQEMFNQSQEFKRREAAIQQYQQQQSERQARDDMATALSQFRSAFPGLNEDDMTSIRKDAVAIVPGMMAQLQPVQALYRSMEVAAWARADMRPKLSSETQEQTEQQKSATRKRKAGAVASSPTSAPKVEARPSYRSDRDMVSEFAQALSEQGLGR
jgi:hypothetical protein